MTMQTSLQHRRTYYQLNKNLPAAEETILRTIRDITELVPDAFNMKSARLAVILGDKHMPYGI